MKRLFLFVFLISTNLFAQFKISFTDHYISEYGDIELTVFAQNLGNDQEIWAVYGPNFYDAFKKYQSNFFLSYVDIINDNRTREQIPSSIVIKTIFETYISMDSPTYYFSSTGLSSGQEWKITFTNIPLDAGNVRIVVLGSEFIIGDMPDADDLRKRKEELLTNAITLALKTSNDKLWAEAADNWENAIQLSSNIIHKYSDKICISFCEKAKQLTSQYKLSEAIIYYEKAKKIDPTIFGKYSLDYSNVQYDYGNQLLNNSEIDEGVKSLKYSYSLSTVNQKRIEDRLNEMKRSQLTSIPLSIIPGLSQFVLQKNTTKGLILLGAFSVTSILTITNKTKADNYYDEYLNATTPQDASAKYELADRQIKEAGVYLGLAIATVIYSIVDQYANTSSYNSFFEITPNLTSAQVGLDHYVFSLSIEIPF